MEDATGHFPCRYPTAMLMLPVCEYKIHHETGHHHPGAAAAVSFFRSAPFLGRGQLSPDWESLLPVLEHPESFVAVDILLLERILRGMEGLVGADSNLARRKIKATVDQLQANDAPRTPKRIPRDLPVGSTFYCLNSEAHRSLSNTLQRDFANV